MGVAASRSRQVSQSGPLGTLRRADGHPKSRGRSLRPPEAASTCCHSDHMSKVGFAHDALLPMELGADDRAPGGAITVALCGSWEPQPPCPLAPHHTRAERAGGQARVRILSPGAPDDERRVRGTIDDALARGTGDTPDGSGTRWRLLASAPSAV